MATDLRELTNGDRDFYRLLGPFLARRAVAREMGGPVWDDDDKTWIVAVDGRHVLGFCAARPGGGRVTYCSDYVTVAHRHQGVYRRLWARRAELFPGPATATCTPASLPVYLEHDFVAVRRRGSFTVVRRG